MLPGRLRTYLATGLGFDQERRVAVLLLAEMDEDGLLRPEGGGGHLERELAGRDEDYHTTLGR